MARAPSNQHVDPLTYAERLELSFHEVQALTALGMPGVWTWNFGDDFAHLYLDAIATNHNADGRGYETYAMAPPRRSSLSSGR